MQRYSQSVQALIQEFAKFPGIGIKSAERMVFFLLNYSEHDIKTLSDTLISFKKNVRFCKKCFSLTESEFCEICIDTSRDQSVLCVVEDFKDVIVIENTNEYNGLYHVLTGHIAPLDGIGPEDLTINQLISRIDSSSFSEVILATNPNVEGDATSLYIKKVTSQYDLKITRLARGIPIGGDIEYADPVTITRSFSGREIF